MLLKKIFKTLDDWVEIQNIERNDDGLVPLGICEIKIIGQTALLEANISLHVPATMDVDVFANYDYLVKKKFEHLLKENGKELDPVGHEAWMPKETEYIEFFTGKWVKAYLAKIEYVMISKAKKAPVKNKGLIVEYLATSPDKVFFQLSKKYKINLDYFLE